MCSNLFFIFMLILIILITIFYSIFQFHLSIFNCFNFTLQSINFSCPLIYLFIECWSSFPCCFWISNTKHSLAGFLDLKSLRNQYLQLHWHCRLLSTFKESCVFFCPSSNDPCWMVAIKAGKNSSIPITSSRIEQTSSSSFSIDSLSVKVIITWLAPENRKPSYCLFNIFQNHILHCGIVYVWYLTGLH